MTWPHSTLESVSWPIRKLPLTLVCACKRAEFDEWFRAGSKPSVRVVMEVVKGDEEE